MPLMSRFDWEQTGEKIFNLALSLGGHQISIMSTQDSLRKLSESLPIPSDHIVNVRSASCVNISLFRFT